MAHEQGMIVLGGEPRQMERVGDLAFITSRLADDRAWRLTGESTQCVAHQRDRHPSIIRVREQREQVWLRAPPMTDAQPATQPVAAIVNESGGRRFK